MIVGSLAKYLAFQPVDHIPRKADDDCPRELRWLQDRRNIEEAHADLAA